MKFTSFADIEKFLASKQSDIKAVNWFFALEDMQALMQALGNPQDKLKIIHVAGTSGKTSTASYIAKMLQLSGHTVGMTVSPHVDTVSERAKIDMKPLDENEFINLFSEFIELPAVKSIQITYFGLLVAFAYWVFARKHVDYAVIEVGMGGRLDATNVISRRDKVCVITDIGLDHTQFLGKDLPSIAGEKAGIITQGNDVFVAAQAEEVMEVFKKKAKQQHAILHVLSSNDSSTPHSLPLFQQRNWSLARFVYDYVADRDNLPKASEAMILQSAKMVIPARMEIIQYHNKTLIVDGSHNGQKLGALSSSIKEKYPSKSIAALVGFVEGKDTALHDGLAALRDITNTLVITSFRGGQDVWRESYLTSTVAAAAKKQGFSDISVVEKPQEALKELLKRPEEILLITGSFFLLNYIRPLIGAGTIDT